MSIAAAYYSPTLNASAAGYRTQARHGYADAARWLTISTSGAPRRRCSPPAPSSSSSRGARSASTTLSRRTLTRSSTSSTSKLADHFIDPRIRKVTIRDLLHMTSGIGDYDAPKYSRDQFAARGRDFSPVDILVGTCASSSCAGLAPAVLLIQLRATRPRARGHVSVRRATGPRTTSSASRRRRCTPSSSLALRRRWPRATDASARFHGIVFGGEPPAQDVWNVSCVGGWTANTSARLPMSRASRTRCIQTESLLRARSLRRTAARTCSTTNGVGWMVRRLLRHGHLQPELGSRCHRRDGAHGHVGDTYGYQSQTTYFPGDGFALAVATNVETSSRAQPPTSVQRVYEVRAAIQGAPPNCTFSCRTTSSGCARAYKKTRRRRVRELAQGSKMKVSLARWAPRFCRTRTPPRSSHWTLLSCIPSYAVEPRLHAQTVRRLRDVPHAKVPFGRLAAHVRWPLEEQPPAEASSRDRENQRRSGARADGEIWALQRVEIAARSRPPGGRQVCKQSSRDRARGLQPVGTDRAGRVGGVSTGPPWCAATGFGCESRATEASTPWLAEDARADRRGCSGTGVGGRRTGPHGVVACAERSTLVEVSGGSALPVRRRPRNLDGEGRARQIRSAVHRRVQPVNRGTHSSDVELEAPSIKQAVLRVRARRPPPGRGQAVQVRAVRADASALQELVRATKSGVRPDGTAGGCRLLSG